METDREAQIRERAHLIWEREGKPDGRDAQHWAQAEREIDNEEKAAAAPFRITTADDPTRPADDGEGEAAKRRA